MFVEPSEVHSVLSRSRRANSGFLEELKQGNLERECVEEICDYEEAREVFENNEMTREFWKIYSRADPCDISPRLNNGTCLRQGSAYSCLCREGYEGRHCQTVFEDSLKCLYQNGQCEHFCDGSGPRRRCSCAEGYKLGEDHRSCVAQESCFGSVEFPCGQLVHESGLNQTQRPQTRLVGANQCLRGACPWQACWTWSPSQVQSRESRSGLWSWLLSSWVSGQRDLALLRLDQVLVLGRDVVPVCLPDMNLTDRELVHVRYHTVSGWGQRTSGGNQNHNSQNAPGGSHLRRMEVPIIQASVCAERSRLNLINHAICAGYLGGRQDSCRGDDGSPLVTEFGSTHFLLGVAGWGRGCVEPGFDGIYTNVAHFTQWIHKTLQDQDQTMKTTDSPSPGLEQKHL